MIRFTAAAPCPVCGGHDRMPRGQGTRCAGFSSDDGQWVHCERPQRAGGLPLDERTEPPTYLHRVGGPCNCGEEHAPAMPGQNGHARPARRIVATYEYHRADGRVLYRVARLEPKGFLPQHMTEAGVWANRFATDERVLYRLPDVLANPGRTVFAVEGEKDADRLAALGLVATTNPGGAASWRKHAAEYAEAFRGHPQAVVIVDNDPDGRRWAAEVASSVHAIGCPVRVLELPGLPAGGDVSDWLDAGHTPAELKQLAKDTPPWVPPSVELVSTVVAGADLPEIVPEGGQGKAIVPDPMEIVPQGDAGTARLTFAVRSPDELAAETVPEPLAGKWLPVGGFGAVYGAPGAGKSLLTTDLHLSLSSGIPWLDVPVIGMVPTLYVLGEGRLWARMEAWRVGHPEADWSLFRCHDGFKFNDPAQVAALLDYIKHEEPALVTFDTLATTIGGDENSGPDMGRVIDACLEIQRMTRYMTAVLLVCHPGKDGAKGIRGHSSLEASLEVIGRVTGQPSAFDASEIGYGCATGGTVELTSRKNKEGARVEPLAATLHSGGARPYLMPTEGPAKLSAGALTMLRALAEAGGTMAAHQWGRDSGLHRTTVERRRTELVARGYVTEDATTGIVTLTDRGEAAE